MIFAVKICPIIDNAQPIIEIGSNVYIFNPDDDMHLQTGVFQGNYQHVNSEIRSLVVLDGNKNFYTSPHTLRIVN